MSDSARNWPAMLRDAPWIAGHRARAYAFGLIGAYLTLASIGVMQGIWLVRQDGDFVEGDFIAYWSAGRMAMQGSFFGCDAHSGQGGAFRQIGSVKIAAFVVVNASGAVTDRDGRVVA